MIYVSYHIYMNLENLILRELENHSAEFNFCVQKFLTKWKDEEELFRMTEEKMGLEIDVHET